MSTLSFWIFPVSVAARVMLGLLFLRSATAKFRDSRDFAAIAANYRLLPDDLAVPASAMLLLAEAGTAILLLAAVGLPTMLAIPAGALALVLLGSFVTAMAFTLHRGFAGISCGCGDRSAPLSWHGVASTALLLPMAVLAALPLGTASVPIEIQAILAGSLLLVLHEAATLLLRPRPLAAAAGRKRG